MPKSVLARRALYNKEYNPEEEIWICECCGEDSEEALAVYQVIRVTRKFPNERAVYLCSRCAGRIDHGETLNS